MVNASLVKELRERTGAGMMDCKKALTETEGDTEKAIAYLREKGLAAAAKKAGRIAGATAIIGGGALLVKTAKDRRKAEQEKLKSITASVEKNRSGGF